MTSFCLQRCSTHLTCELLHEHCGRVCDFLNRGIYGRAAGQDCARGRLSRYGRGELEWRTRTNPCSSRFKHRKPRNGIVNSNIVFDCHIFFENRPFELFRM